MPPGTTKAVLAIRALEQTAAELTERDTTGRGHGPPSVTALRAAGARGASVILEVDGVTLGKLPAEVVQDARLHTGMAWTHSAADTTLRIAWAAIAYQGLLRLLSHRGRSRADLRRRLLQRGHPPEAIDSALDRAERVGLVDDAAALTIVLDRELRRGRGLRLVEQRLRSLGFSESCIRAAISSHGHLPDERDQASHAAAKWSRTHGRGLDASTARRRLAGFLGRRGFAPGTCRSVVDDVIPRR